MVKQRPIIPLYPAFSHSYIFIILMVFLTKIHRLFAVDTFAGRILNSAGNTVISRNKTVVRVVPWNYAYTR